MSSPKYLIENLVKTIDKEFTNMNMSKYLIFKKYFSEKLKWRISFVIFFNCTIVIFLTVLFTNQESKLLAQDTNQTKRDKEVSIKRKKIPNVNYMGIEFGKQFENQSAYREYKFDTDTLESWSNVRLNKMDQPVILQKCHQYVMVKKKSKIVVGLTFYRKDSAILSKPDFYRRRDEENDPQFQDLMTAEELFILTSKALVKKYKDQVNITNSEDLTTGKIRVGNHDFHVEVRHNRNDMRIGEEFTFRITDLTTLEGDQIVIDTDKF